MNNRITPENITKLSDNEIFCYGANLGGIHGGGAARTAMQWGAVMGRWGFEGNTCGIPTKDGGGWGTKRPWIGAPLTIKQIRVYVEAFIGFAEGHPEKKFLVTAVGTGLAGISIEEIAPLFTKAISIPNIYLPQVFWDILLPGGA